MTPIFATDSNGLLLALAIFLTGGLLCLLAGPRARLAHPLGAATAALASAIGFTSALPALSAATPQHTTFAWPAAGITLTLTLDPLAAFFLLPIFLLTFCGALYAIDYLHFPARSWRAGLHWFFYNSLGASMAAVVLAANGLFFLLAWELMSLSSFFLVTHDYQEEKVRQAGWLYLVATHLGAAFLFFFFFAASRVAGSLDFASFAALRALPPESTLPLVVAALVGFGAKAGIFPLHVWLPDAHPAAPSHVSAIMSGVMIKTALYGLLRMLTFLPPLPAWVGIAIALLGISGALFGIAMAATQTDIKRSLAYSTVENIGLIFLGLGLWLFCLATGHPAAALLALSGALLHIWNHSLFKGLLFLGAGALAHATGNRELSAMGGLLRRMPLTGSLLFFGAAAIAALPPLNGFVSEWLLYLSLFQAGQETVGGTAFLFMLLAILLALTGGLVVLVMTRLLGVALQGEPRTPAAAAARESSAPLLAAMAIPAGCCLLIGVAPQLPLQLIDGPLVALLSPTGIGAAATMPPFGPAWSLALLTALGVMVVVVAIRTWRLRNTGRIATWGCGYLKPSSRMAYTAGGYSQLAQDTLFCSCVMPTADSTRSAALFPPPARFDQERPDPVLTRCFLPLFRKLAEHASTCRGLQAGQLNIYVLYIFTATILLLGWSIMAP